MNTILSYNRNANYSAKDLKGGHNSTLTLLDLYLAEKGPDMEIQLLNILKNYHIAAQTSPTAAGYDEWSLSNALLMKFYNSHGK